MLQSKTCAYAIRALTNLARNGKTFKPAEEIARTEGIPCQFLRNILNSLVEKGMLDSSRGPGGGYRLIIDPEQTTLYQIRGLVDGLTDLEECAVGLSHCDSQTPCPLHKEFIVLRRTIVDYLRSTTLSQMAQAGSRDY